MVMLVVGSLADVEVESVPVVVFGLDPVFVIGAALKITGGLWRGVSDSTSGASLVSLGFFGLDSDASESFGAGGGLLSSALAGGVGGTLLPVDTWLASEIGSPP